MVDPISFSEEHSSKKEMMECKPGPSGEDNAEDQVPKPVRYMYCKIVNNCMSIHSLAVEHTIFSFNCSLKALQFIHSPTQ